MFHANGWCFPWGMAAVGGTNVCLRRVDAAEVYATIARRGVNHLCGAPVVLNMLANAPEGVRRPLPGKVRILTAGAPPPAAVLHRTESIGFEVSHGYGLTETAGLVVCCAWKGWEWNKLPASERARLKARQGVRTPGMAEVDIIDGETGRSVPRDGSTTVFSLPIGNRRLPPIFTDTATRRQPIPAVNFEKFRPNLKFSKIFEIKKEKIW
jgi:acyl-CoA synthetase (AMP-forming)/AMP-acid ligase II